MTTELVNRTDAPRRSMQTTYPSTVIVHKRLTACGRSCFLVRISAMLGLVDYFTTYAFGPRDT